MKHIFIFPLSFFLMISDCYSQNLEFYKEDLFFEIKDSSFLVTGYYYLSNTTEQNARRFIFYPFPLGKEFGKPGNVKITNCTQNNTIGFLPAKDSVSISFPVEIEAFGFIKLRISYQQKLYSGKAEYILLTTKYWDKPLEQADYRLSVGKDIQINNFSFSPDSSVKNNQNTEYIWHRKNFMPEQNMVFIFSKKQ